jgi:hypothetical protein
VARDERGAALVLVVLATVLLTALGAALVMLSSVETLISSNYRNAQEALYAADAGIERAVQDLLAVPQWNDVLSGAVASAFIDSSTHPTLPDGTRLDLTGATAALQADTNIQGLWGANDPVWRLYAYGPVSGLLPTNSIDSRMYVAVWVGDDPSETDDNPLVDGNGILTLRAEAYGPLNTRRVIEATVSRTSSAEIERGHIAQRGQDELNQRSRKAAVQTPGRRLTGMRLNVDAGTMVAQ